MKPETTIAILTHNRSWHFAQTIASVRQFTRAPYIVKVFDIASDATHAEHVKQFDAPDCEVYRVPSFLSCLDGRREALSHIETPFVAYLDDDIRVGPEWLGSLLAPMRNDKNAGAVAANIVQEGKVFEGGVRNRVAAGAHYKIENCDANYTGKGDVCIGGATLYRTDVLRATEYRKEFNGGYEDWDQTLQISVDQGRAIYGSRATVFHRHMPESGGYFEDRWRWTELFDAAFGMFDRWGVRTAVDKVLIEHLRRGIAIPREYVERLSEVLT